MLLPPTDFQETAPFICNQEYHIIYCCSLPSGLMTRDSLLPVNPFFATIDAGPSKPRRVWVPARTLANPIAR